MKFAVAIVALAAQAAAQTAFLASPVLLWTGNIPPVNEGNECALAPANPLLLCTSAEGLVSALPTTTTSGAAVATWVYRTDPTDGSVSSSTSGITFSSDGSSFVYSTTASDTTGSPTICHVHHVSVPDGTSKWLSESLIGACSGTPLLSGNDAYVFLTHNGNASGTFSVLSASDGTIVYQESDPVQFLSPPGIYFSPLQGNYPEGIGNNNDIVVFGNRPKPTDDAVPDLNSIYAFQFPIGFVAGSNVTSTLGLVNLYNKTVFQATTAPLITNSGKSMFWGVSRSNVVGWIDGTFDRDPGGANIGFGRGDPPSLPILADLAIGANLVTPTLYTGNAGPGFAALSTAGDLALLWNYTTALPVYTQAKVAPATADEVVFFIEDAGFAYALDAASGELLWKNATSGSVRGNFALNAASDTIYFADTSGIVSAWQVAELGAPTSFAPIASPQSSGPTLNATLSPAASPSATGSSAPAAVPTVAGNFTYDVILANPNVTILPTLISILNLTSALSTAKSTLTVFAPYDSAFTTAFNQSYIDLLTDDPKWVHHLSCLVSAHAIPKFTDTTDLWTDGENVTNLSKEPITLGTNPPSVNGIAIDSADNVASNGVVHFIAEPILPSCVNDSFATVLSNYNFTTLASLVGLSGLSNALIKDLPLTLLAPTNEAFEKVPADILEYLTDPANVGDLVNILFYHIFRDNIYLDPVDGTGTGVFDVAYDGSGVEFSYDNGSFLVADVPISIPSILAKNGIVHGIDEVLIPPGLDLPTPQPTTSSPAASTDAPTPKPTTAKPTAAPTRKPSATQMPTSSGSSTGLSALVAAAVVIGLWM